MSIDESYSGCEGVRAYLSPAASTVCWESCGNGTASDGEGTFPKAILVVSASLNASAVYMERMTVSHGNHYGDRWITNHFSYCLESIVAVHCNADCTIL